MFPLSHGYHYCNNRLHQICIHVCSIDDDFNFGEQKEALFIFQNTLTIRWWVNKSRCARKHVCTYSTVTMSVWLLHIPFICLSMCMNFCLCMYSWLMSCKHIDVISSLSGPGTEEPRHLQLTTAQHLSQILVKWDCNDPQFIYQYHCDSTDLLQSPVQGLECEGNFVEF